MNDLRDRTPGVYRTTANPGAPRGWVTATIAGPESAGELRHAIAEALDFPDWYGGTWDALLDCLTDLSWRPAPGYVIGWADYGRLARGQKAAWRTAFDVMREAVGRRIEMRMPPMFVLLLGDGPTTAPDGSTIEPLAA
jgi:hypothetical protein